ncbi:carbohydrate ABC transporter permease [Ruania alba]|uniref:Carbohydrate ABC transporter membrane protein 1, CUT1 family n=1 Tax=Ruania alba TaxID=648782 RepID=A0A1H5MIY9_9MICO|nr:sugar ABC transporter permease [Ruania alba]SEE89246.1 carbohydrate ABC transporter membrane protein 1, CUT1 family [Ruania alba]
MSAVEAGKAVDVHERRRRRKWTRTRLAPYVFIAPFYLVFAAFIAGPGLFAVHLSLHSWAGIGTPSWVGLENYATLLRSDDFRAAAANTGWYVAGALLLVIPIALVLAALLNSRGVRWRGFFRTSFFLPVVLSPVIVALLFNILFDTQTGLVNSILSAVLGLPPVGWLDAPVLARLTIIIILIWRYSGYLMIFFLAGLQNIPRELYEASSIDGASPVRQFFSVTIPMLRPVTAFVVVIVLTGTAQIFEEPYILTDGGPGNASISLTMFIYRAAFVRQQFGLAAAAGVLLFITVFAASRVIASAFGVGRESK